MPSRRLKSNRKKSVKKIIKKLIKMYMNIILKKFITTMSEWIRIKRFISY